MTEIEQLEDRLRVVEAVIEYLEKWLEKKQNDKKQIVWDLNRARRLEREAKELQQ